MLSARCDNNSQMTGTLTWETFPGKLSGTQQLCSGTEEMEIPASRMPEEE